MDAEGEGPDTWLRLSGPEAVLFRECGAIRLSWAVGPTALVASVTSWSEPCAPRLSAVAVPWLARTSLYRAHGDGWQVLDESGAVLATPDDPRVTAAGKLLRSARVDEIPQLWNVLRGDMSLVGPRPERPEFTARFSETVAGWELRHAARPGMTGLAQISGDYASEPEIKLRYDLAYLNNWSFGLDLAILLRTLPVILTRRGI